MLAWIFSGLSRFVALAGIGGIAQTVSTEILSALAKSELTDTEFNVLRARAEAQGYVLEAA